MEMVVWVDGWQLRCCGDPFGVGSEVSWTLLTEVDAVWFGELLGSEVAATVDAMEERHLDVSGGPPPTRAVVRRITAVHCRYAPRPDGDPRERFPVRGSTALTEITLADGWTEDRDDLEFVGYLVHLVSP